MALRRVRRSRSSGPGQYLSARAGYYVFFVVLFVVGVGFGAAAVRALDDAQKAELLGYMEGYLHGLGESGPQVPAAEIWRGAVTSTLRTAALLWAAGPVVVGLLLAPAIIFMRGFVIGFAVGFLAYEMSLRGVLLAAVGVFPQNLIAVPAILSIAVVSTAFSVRMLRPKRHAGGSFGSDFAGYSLIVLAMMALLAVASTFEAYVAPVLMRLVAGAGG